VFLKVDSLIYSIDAADNVNMDMKLNCATAPVATSPHSVLDGRKMAQQLSWGAQNPGHPNPYAAVNVGANDKQIAFKVSMAYSELALAIGVEAPP
jgi:hypothetical protein